MAGRSYYQWMARGAALVQDVLPVLVEGLAPGIDAHAAARLQEMLERYSSFIERERRRICPGMTRTGTSRRIDAGLDALARRYDLPELARERLRRLLNALARDPLAPTAVRDPLRRARRPSRRRPRRARVRACPRRSVDG